MTRAPRYGQAKYTGGNRPGTSDGFRWRGLPGECWTHAEDDPAEIRPRDTEFIVMPQGWQRGDGRLQDRDAGPGMVWLNSAGIREYVIHLYGGIVESLYVYLPASPLSGTAFREIDAEINDKSPAGRIEAETLAMAGPHHAPSPRSGAG